jgi:hypothetical protein
MRSKRQARSVLNAIVVGKWDITRMNVEIPNPEQQVLGIRAIRIGIEMIHQAGRLKYAITVKRRTTL